MNRLRSRLLEIKHGETVSKGGTGGDSARKGGRKAKGRSIRLRSFVLVPALVVVALGGYAAGGFVRFAEEISALDSPTVVEKADGIVVLTGGAMRLDQGIELLKNGRARRLLISGVHPETSAETLSRLTATDPALFECCIDIDHAALDTIGNVEMTRRWARAHGFDTLILVTSDYHMPRSLLEFSRLADAPEITPYPVERPDLWNADRPNGGQGLRVLLSEYVKFLAAKVRMRLGLASGISAPGLHAKIE